VNKTQWNKEYPTNPGMYWFYGYRWKGDKGRGIKPSFYLVRAKQGNNCIVYVCEGVFFYNSEVGEGLFTEAILPDNPF